MTLSAALATQGGILLGVALIVFFAGGISMDFRDRYDRYPRGALYGGSIALVLAAASFTAAVWVAVK